MESITATIRIPVTKILYLIKLIPNIYFDKSKIFSINKIINTSPNPLDAPLISAELKDM